MPLPDTFSLLILGQGTTGLAVARWACRHMPTRVSSVTVYGGASSKPSERTRELEAAGVRFDFGTQEVRGGYDICVASPGIPESSDFFRSAAEASGEIMGEPEFAWRLSPQRWCAVTGTNGKTTTTSLVNAMLNASGIACSAVGNIGDACISAVDARAPGSWFAAELSSYQLATTSRLAPRVAVLLNITADHLAWHGSFEAYAAAKLKVFQNLGSADLAVVDAEDPGIARFADTVYAPGRRVCRVALADAGTDEAAFVRDGVLFVRARGTEHGLAPVSALQIPGHHNLINALAASAAAIGAGAKPDRVAAALAAFAPLEHRVEPCGVVGGVRFVNDSKATNTDAVLKALAAFPNDRVILLLGGHDKGTELGAFARKACREVAGVVTFGEASARFQEALRAPAADAGTVLETAKHLGDAVDAALALAGSGDVVLLSPACSSFDEFSGFEERGRAFKARVAELAAAESEVARVANR
ncbi:MAG: UDP-N-acetylmuramoyl-L-alanine--D-glutamate ligase [Coriobacteriaceae bacterium]|nr:UDP-N-acetylmuramoyl-L-alanine--D-glutamate ligase [Coriobacteriaceae bacterium]